MRVRPHMRAVGEVEVGAGEGEGGQEVRLDVGQVDVRDGEGGEGGCEATGGEDRLPLLLSEDGVLQTEAGQP